MKSKSFDLEKAKAVILYTLSKLENKDFLHVFKVMYFAEQEHLVSYGSPITEDSYVAMRNGPVPSILYDLFKAIRGDGFRSREAEDFYAAFKVNGNYIIEALQAPELDYLSQSEIKCLDSSIHKNGNLPNGELIEKSHDAAWKQASPNNEIGIIAMAMAGGADEDAVSYINEYFENQQIVIC